MKVLVLNAWSSSLKYQLLNMPEGQALCEWLVERIGIEWWMFTVKINWNKTKLSKEIPNHTDALNTVIEMLLTGETKVLDSINDLDVVGHRVVHGWEKFAKSAIVTPEVIEEIKNLIDLAPLHNPANLQGIEAISSLLPDVKQVVVFDTSFHQTMDKANYLYAIPYSYYENYKIRRYGFHWTSHKYVTSRVCEILDIPYIEQRIINCHVGNGASICAVKNGKVVETSMWFTPLEGLMMGTRSGDLDPAIINFIANKEGKTIAEIDTMLNKASGILWVSEISSDLRDIEDGYQKGDERCILTLEMYVNRIVKYIGSYVALMWGVDVITFTAWVLENSGVIRKMIVDKLSFLGVKLEESANDFRGEERVISTSDSNVKVVVVPTNEELVIATDAYTLTK